MHEHHVGIAAAAGVERLAGALRDDFHLDAGLLLEQRQNVPEQAGILRRGGRRHDNRFVLGRSGRAGQDGGGRDGGNEHATIKHVILLFHYSDEQFSRDEFAGFFGARCCEELRGGRVLDQPAAMHEHDIAGEALRLAEVMRRTSRP